MKHHYLTPTTEEIFLRLEETICGVSGKGFTLKTGPDAGGAGSFDSDSD
jgi:hypothetical protein